MYIREITNLFKPYIINTNSTPSYALDSERERERSNNDFKNTSKETSQKNTPDTRKVHDNSISPPTNRANNSNNNSKYRMRDLGIRRRRRR
jgi:hypothetical protein